MIKKIISYIIVGVLVFLTCFLFCKSFAFEANKKEQSNQVDPELTNKLYGYITDVKLNVPSIYNYSRTTLENLNPEVVFAFIYDYIEKNHPEVFIKPSKEQFVGDNKIIKELTINDYNKYGRIIFGNDKTFNNGNVIFKDNLRADYDNTNNKFIIMEIKNPLKINNMYVKREISRTGISENGDVINIYEYFITCSKETGICYNDEMRTNINYDYKYNNQDIKLKKGNQIYKHSFKKDSNGNYYWFSTEKK